MNIKKKSSKALSEVAGVSQPEATSAAAIAKLKAQRSKKTSLDALLSGILRGDITHLSRAITLIESANPAHAVEAAFLIKNCLPHANQSIRIGITGVPGVGKSTFIEALGKLLTSQGKKVAVLAVDPSSSLSKGSILGDKTRMEELVKDPNAFIRPSASGESLGGVARKTRETIILCEAAGYDIILVETVGVGQSETAVHSMVDFFLLLKLAGAGDQLQGIKRGIIEMADAVIINKADGDNMKRARMAKTDFQRALHLYPPKVSGWQPQVALCSATEQQGIQEAWQMMEQYVSDTKANDYFETKRSQQLKYWLLQTIEDRLKLDFFQNPKVKKALELQLTKVAQNEISPFEAAEALFQLKETQG